MKTVLSFVLGVTMLASASFYSAPAKAIDLSGEQIMLSPNCWDCRYAPNYPFCIPNL